MFLKQPIDIQCSEGSWRSRITCHRFFGGAAGLLAKAILMILRGLIGSSHNRLRTAGLTWLDMVSGRCFLIIRKCCLMSLLLAMHRLGLACNFIQLILNPGDLHP